MPVKNVLHARFVDNNQARVHSGEYTEQIAEKLRSACVTGMPSLASAGRKFRIIRIVT